MDEFSNDEQFFRAVKRSDPPMVTSDGKISSALFKNNNPRNGIGISVDCKDDRIVDDVVEDMRNFFSQRLHSIYSIDYVNICKAKACVFRSPTTNIHHAEIYRNSAKEAVSNIQAYAMASSAILVYHK